MIDDEKTLDELLGDALDNSQPVEESTAEAPVEATDEIKAAPEAVETPTELQEPEPDSDALPPGWGPETAEEWRTLSPTLQQQIVKRQKELQSSFTKTTQDFAEIKGFHDELRPIVQKYERDVTLQGLSVPQAVGKLFELQKFSQENPAEYLKWAAKSLGVDLQGLHEPDSMDEFLDPEVSTLKTQLSQTQQQLNGLLQAQQSQQQNSLIQTVEQFSQSKDASGEPAYPYFEKVQAKMMALLPSTQGSPTERLKEAYEQAVWLDPEIRNGLISAQAPKAPDINVKTTGGSNVKSGKVDESREQTINRLFDEAGVAA